MKKVRFAPSPTGHLHIGGVRTALFNYLYAKNAAGEFILRIEDTDVERSSPEMAEEISAGLSWLGMKWDHEPYYQSHHFEKYREIAFRLLREGKAYRCFCTPEEIEARKKSAPAGLFKYDRKCISLDAAEIERHAAKKTPFVIRFFIPEGVTGFKDRVHKEMKINNSELDDYVLLKSDGSPTYHLSVVADDSSMGISDVIRGDDHISNTFKQILLFRALALKPPKYTHLPLIFGADKKKLSKRHGETSILEFKHKGYLPEAIITYLSQLSWLPGENKKIFTMADLVQKFNLQKLSKNSPVFDYEKLRFLNSLAIRRKPPGAIYDILSEDKEFAAAFSEFAVEKKEALIELVKPRMKTLIEFKEKFKNYLSKEGPVYRREELEKLAPGDKSGLRKNLGVFLDRLSALDSFDSAGVEEALRSSAEEAGVSHQLIPLHGHIGEPHLFHLFI